MRVLIVGAGGHALVVADILLQAHDKGSEQMPIGFLDDRPDLHGRRFFGLPVLGALSRWADFAHDASVVGIGDNQIRRRIFLELEKSGESMAVACHPGAVLGSEVGIGPGTMIAAGVVVNPVTEVGKDVILNTGCTVDHHSRIGDHCHIAPGAHLGGEVRIGSGSLIGIGAAVLPGRSVGPGTIVGAGAVVTQDLPEGVTALGVPARIVA